MWLSKLLPNKEVLPEIEITDEMLRLRAFKVDQNEHADASPSAGDNESSSAISKFGAKPYLEDEQKELSEIVKAFNDRHGTEFTKDDFVRYEPAYQETQNVPHLWGGIILSDRNS